MAYDPPQRVETNLTAQTNFTTPEDDSWGQKNLLSLDGGGIRGFWTLLALEKLMKHIGEIEENHDSYHSFSPQDWPTNGVTQLPRTAREGSLVDWFTGGGNSSAEDRFRNIPKTRRYLPCHYFDYIGGSSTGALVAIMLGRFRMTVDDCVSEYITLGGKVFGKPRLVSTLRFGVAYRMKYKSAGLKNVFEDVAIRRCEQSRDVPQRVTFPSKRGMCRTFVTTERFAESMDSATLYLIRSYDHHLKRYPDGKSKNTPNGTIAFSSRANTGMSDGLVPEESEQRTQDHSRNYGKAQKFEIWEVARAATAALFYFEPLRVAVSGPAKHIILTDAGIKSANNPTQVGTREIEEMHGKPAVGIVVSVGTARHDERTKNKGLFPAVGKIKATIAEGADPEIVHRDVKDAADGRFPYYRFDDPQGLNMEFDEWLPKRGPFTKTESGSKTLKEIQDAFNRWIAQDDNSVSNNFQKCADALVQRRIRRTANKDRWERYSTGAKFTCLFLGCEETFIHRKLFLEHLEQTHAVEAGNLERRTKRCRKQWEYQNGSAEQ